jgi:Protein of unknown function (DUF2815)
VEKPVSDKESAKQTRIVVGPARLFYVAALVSKKNDQGKDKYSVSPLFPKSDKASIAAIQKAVAIAEANYVKHNGPVPADFGRPLRDGDAEFASGKKKDPEYKGHMFIATAASDYKPGLVDANLQQIVNASEVYSGMFGRVDIHFYWYIVRGNHGVGCSLNHIQKVRDGTPKSGAGAPEAAFDRYEDTDSEADNIRF